MNTVTVLVQNVRLSVSSILQIIFISSNYFSTQGRLTWQSLFIQFIFPQMFRWMILKLLTCLQDMKPMYQCTLNFFTILDLTAFYFLYSSNTYLQLVVYKYD